MIRIILKQENLKNLFRYLNIILHVHLSLPDDTFVQSRGPEVENEECQVSLLAPKLKHFPFLLRNFSFGRYTLYGIKSLVLNLFQNVLEFFFMQYCHLFFRTEIYGGFFNFARKHADFRITTLKKMVNFPRFSPLSKYFYAACM